MSFKFPDTDIKKVMAKYDPTDCREGFPIECYPSDPVLLNSAIRYESNAQERERIALSKYLMNKD